MKFVTSLLCTLLLSSAAFAQNTMRESVLKKAAINNGLKPLDEIFIQPHAELEEIGKKLFESELMSLNSNMSCKTCHLDEFSSADGLPNAVGTGGEGEGQLRMMGSGDIVPRNTLPLWGRGTKGFETFFWDGKVQKDGGHIFSQFGEKLPSEDPLVVSVHLPFVEVREMVQRDDLVELELLKEDQDTATALFEILTERVRTDPMLGPQLAQATGKKESDLKFIDIAHSVAAFIRGNFKVTNTRFHDFVFGNSKFTKSEINGGLLFYGKGGCASCHSGTLFSDLDFHVIPFEQAGFGKNGFGVDYGLYNATQRADDVYKFRTPPLINVSQTGPYSHSGRYNSLKDVITAHLDPLKNVLNKDMSLQERRELTTKIGLWTQQNMPGEPLTDAEIEDLLSFLKSLDISDP